MDSPTIKHFAACVAAVAAIALSTYSSASERTAFRCAQENVGVSQPSRSPLEAIRRDCPLLGEIVEKFALQDLGEEFPDESPSAQPRAIATLAIHVTQGDAEATRRSAELARAAGATKPQFEELLYLTAVYVGIPQAIDATRALSGVLVEQTADRCSDRLAGVAVRQF